MRRNVWGRRRASSGPGGTGPRLFPLWVLVIGVALLAIPFPVLGGGPTRPHPPRGLPSATAAVPASVHPMGSPRTTLPGSDPSSERYVNAPQLAFREWEAERNASRAAAAPLLPATPAPARPTSELPGPDQLPGGTITGRIYDITHGRPIDGALVQVESFGTTLCDSACGSNSTDANGDFVVSSPAGTVVVAFSAKDYVSNRTWASVGSGGTLSLGTLYMVHDGYVVGVVEDNTPDQSPLAGINVSAMSRDGTITGPPGNASSANGSFTVAVPPLPSELDFSPNSTAFQPNTTYANVTPYETLNVGVVHLEGGVPIYPTLVDATTGLPIPAQNPSQITVCSPTGLCFLPTEETGPHPTGYGLPGPTILKVYAIGYLLNTTQIPDLPNTNQPVAVGPIEMIPLAAMEISSNLTGGPAPPAGWPMPAVNVFACSLDGLLVTYQPFTSPILAANPCFPQGVSYSFLGYNALDIGTTTLILTPPLYDAVVLEQVDLTAAPTMPDFPIANNQIYTSGGGGTPTGPWTLANTTWANASPDHVTDLGSIDVTPGTYLTGNVSIAGYSGSLEGQFSVQVCSTDIPAECGSTVGSSDAQTPVLGCPASPGTFCAPAPPGPDQVVVTRFGPGFQNRTWVEVPRGCCGQDTHPTYVGWINLTLPPLEGNLSGSVVGQTGGPGSATVPLNGALVTIQACPVGPPPVGLPTSGCTETGANQTGQFELNASLGWDIVSVFSNAYQGNWTWVDVTGNNSTGVIELAPKAEFIGQVLSPGGGGIYSAIVSACPVGDPTQCYILGDTNTFGQFNGTAPGGPLPWGTYEITASSSGYATGWTYANSTPGALTIVPTFTLSPIGSTPGAPRLGPAANGSVGAWVDGRLVDSVTGYGVPAAQIDECSVVGGGCTGNVYPATAGGTFNVSLLTGQYFLEVNVSGYPPTDVYVNATSATVVHLGVTELKHLPWVHGRVLIAPWQSLAVTDGLGAAVYVVGCPPISSSYGCGPAVPTDNGGFFNVSVPVSSSAELEFFGRGVAGLGSPGQGYLFSTEKVSATQTYVDLPTSLALAPSVGIYGSVTGRLADGSTWNATDLSARDPCAFCSAMVTPVGSATAAYFQVQTGGGGNFTAFEPSDASSTLLVGTGQSFWWANTTVPGAVAPAASLSASPINLPHFGWVDLRAVDSNTSRPIPYFYATASSYDAGNATTFQITGLSRGDGYLNLSAPLGAKVYVNVSADGYQSLVKTTAVRQSKSVDLGVYALLPGGSSGVWFRSLAVNTVNTTPFETVVDAKTRAALPDATVSTTTPLGATVSTVFTNGIGQFLTFSPPQLATGLYVRMAGYEPWVFHWVTANVSTVSVKSINVTGDGVVAGRVVTEPGSVPVYDTEVDVCPVSTSCTNYGLTNATGVFWVTAPPGADTVTVVSNTYLTNVTASLVVTTDTWSWAGTIPIFAFATITGSLRGLPNGNLLTNANVSVCSRFGSPVGPCGTVVPTDANGSFLVPVPPGIYILEFQAAGYNTTYLPVDPLPAQNLSVGTIFLLEYGEVAGQVVSTISGAAIANATVSACAQTTAGLCSAYVRTDGFGAFELSAPPGLDLVTATASGYFDNYTTVYVPSGTSATPVHLDLLPLSVAIPETISGSVVAANRSDAPIPGAFVSADIQGVAIGSSSTDSAGQFSLAIDWGSYSLVASAPGYAPVRESLIVHTNLSGIVLALPTMTYTVSGTVRDALTGAPLNAVTVSEGTSTLASTSATGEYAFLVPNGTFDLVAAATGATGASYGALSFTITVSGHAVARDIELTATNGAVAGVVVDAESGLPVASATIAVYGPSSAQRLALVGVSSSGTFSIALGPGTYALNVSAPGYATTSVDVQVPTSGPVTIALVPFTTSGALGSIVPLPLVVGALAGVVIAAVALTIWWRRRPPPPPPAPRWTLEDLDEPGVTDAGAP